MLPARRSPHDREIVRLALPAFGALAAEPLYILVDTAIVGATGASTRVHPFAQTYLRLSILGAPALLITLAGAGYLRGLQDTRTTLVIAVLSNAANVVIEVFFVYGLDLGIAGSAWGTVLAQYGAALAYVAIVARSVRREHASVRPQAAGIRASANVGGRLVVRTGSLLAAFLAATAIASRIGDDDVAAHQIAFQVFLFLGLSLDALAIAGQAMIGRFLGAENAGEARAAARRMIEWGVAVGVVFGGLLAVLRPAIVPLFTPDPDVPALALQVLPTVAAMPRP